MAEVFEIEAKHSRYHPLLPDRQQLIKHGAEFVAGELFFLEEFAEDVAGLKVVTGWAGGAVHGSAYA